MRRAGGLLRVVASPMIFHLLGWHNLLGGIDYLRKYVPLGSAADAPFLTFGGEVRTRCEWIDNTDFGSGPQDTGGYLLTRYLPYVSLTLPKLPGGWGSSFSGKPRARSATTTLVDPVPSTKTPLISYRRLPRSRFRWERAS
jgi:hypothetical protein